MTLFNGICDDCIYGAGMPIICTICGGILRGGLCLPCDLREKNLYNYDPNAYSFNNSNYFPQPQDENYLCGNNSHDDYDCQQQFPFIYKQEPSYNQDYDDNYYSHDLPSFPCCDYCGGSHETFQCQLDNQNVDFSGFDQIQTPQYPDVNHSSPEIITPQDSDIHQLIKECSIKVPEEQKQKMENTMLELVKICQEKEFLCIHDDIDDLIESAINSKLLLINSNSQHLDKKEQEVKNVVEQPAEHGNHSIQSLQNFKVVHKSSISFKNTSQISSIHSIAPIQSTKEPEHLLKLNAEIADTIIESIPLPIPVQDGNSQQEEIDIITETDDVLHPGIENVDPEGDIRFLEELLIDDSILSDELSDANFEENPLIPRPPPKPPDVETDVGEEIQV
nr:hypothetical protein [Tanacetum cinerariifolium]